MRKCLSPAANFYCIYHRRQPGQLLYNVAHEGIYLNQFNVPDCTNWSPILNRHAQQLVAAGVDYVAADMTNLVGASCIPCGVICPGQTAWPMNPSDHLLRACLAVGL